MQQSSNTQTGNRTLVTDVSHLLHRAKTFLHQHENLLQCEVERVEDRKSARRANDLTRELDILSKKIIKTRSRSNLSRLVEIATVREPLGLIAYGNEFFTERGEGELFLYEREGEKLDLKYVFVNRAKLKVKRGAKDVEKTTLVGITDLVQVGFKPGKESKTPELPFWYRFAKPGVYRTLASKHPAMYLPHGHSLDPAKGGHTPMKIENNYLGALWRGFREHHATLFSVGNYAKDLQAFSILSEVSGEKISREKVPYFFGDSGFKFGDRDSIEAQIELELPQIAGRISGFHS